MRRTLTLTALPALALAAGTVPGTAAAPPDPAVLRLTVTGPARVLGGSEHSYRLQVRNTGPVTPAQDVQVSVPVPGDAFLDERPRNSRVSGRTVIVDLGRLQPGTSKFAVIGLRWEENASGNRCVVGLARADNASRVAEAQACTRITPLSRPDPVSVPTVRMQGPARLAAGAVGTYAVTVVNTSNAATESAVVGVVLAPGMFVARRSPAMIVTDGMLGWRLGRIPPGGTRRVGVGLRAASTTRGLRCNVAYTHAANASRWRRSGACTTVTTP